MFKSKVILSEKINYRRRNFFSATIIYWKVSFYFFISRGKYIFEKNAELIKES